MGGEAGIQRQRERGKLTERIDALADDGSFREFAGLVGRATYEDNELTDFTPKGAVEGFAELDGRQVVISAGDFTVRGGSGGGSEGGLGSELRSNQRALEWRLPYVRLLDAAGGSVRGFETLGRTYLPDGNVWSTLDMELLRMSPTVSAVLGWSPGCQRSTSAWRTSA